MSPRVNPASAERRARPLLLDQRQQRQANAAMANSHGAVLAQARTAAAAAPLDEATALPDNATALPPSIFAPPTSIQHLRVRNVHMHEDLSQAQFDVCITQGSKASRQLTAPKFFSTEKSLAPKNF